jgi:hypothetical protein
LKRVLGPNQLKIKLVDALGRGNGNRKRKRTNGENANSKIIMR